MKTAIFLSGRNKSTRLRRKLFLPLLHSTTLEMLIERLKFSRRAERIILTTSVHEGDAVFLDIAKDHSIELFRGSPEDKLERYRDACEQYGIDAAVVVDADDLLADAWVIDEIFAEQVRSGADYVLMGQLPLGATGFGVTRNSLSKICAKKTITNTEVWGAMFSDDPDFKTVILPAPAELRRPHYRMTLDFAEDYAFFKAVFEVLYPRNQCFDLRDVVALLDARPDIAALSAPVSSPYHGTIAARSALTPSGSPLLDKCM
jgi:spore coat polysaccharide biosynthesis protein SpsF